MKKTVVNIKSSPSRTSEKMSSKKKTDTKTKQTGTSFKVQKFDKHPFGFNYNVQVFNDGVYAGQGRFCKTMDEVNKFKKNMKLEPAKPVSKKGKTK